MDKFIEFEAEIRKVEAKKLITNDMEYKLILTTSDNRLIELAKLPADSMIKVTIEIET